jgi:hypothetical protein
VRIATVSIFTLKWKITGLQGKSPSAQSFSFGLCPKVGIELVQADGLGNTIASALFGSQLGQPKVGQALFQKCIEVFKEVGWYVIIIRPRAATRVAATNGTVGSSMA